MKLNISKYSEFIPSWEGNQELPVEEQIKVRYKRMTGELASQTMTFYDDNSVKFDYPRIVRACVTGIDNLIDCQNRPIQSAKELLESVGTHGLVTEIATHILTDSKPSNELEKKNNNSDTLGQ